MDSLRGFVVQTATGSIYKISPELDDLGTRKIVRENNPMALGFSQCHVVGSGRTDQHREFGQILSTDLVLGMCLVVRPLDVVGPGDYVYTSEMELIAQE